MSQTFYIYLAGPIRGLSYDEAVGWREKVKQMLPRGIETLSPMRKKEMLAGEKEIKGQYDGPLYCPRGFVTRDRFDVQRCDLVIMNLEKCKTGINRLHDRDRLDRHS